MHKSCSELKRIARAVLYNRYTVPMGAFVMAGFITSIIEIPFSMSFGEHPTQMQQVISYLVSFLLYLIGAVLSAGVLRVHLNMIRQKPFGLTNLFEPFREGAERFVGAAFLLLLLDAICSIPLIASAYHFYFADITPYTIAILIGCALISVGLIIYVNLTYSLVYLLLLDHPQMKFLDSFRSCGRMMKKNKGRFFYLFLSFLGWGLLLVCSFGVGSLWITPYMNQTKVNFYLDCTGELDRLAQPNSYTKQTEAYSSVR